MFGAVCRNKKIYLASFEDLGEGATRGRVNTDNYLAILEDFFDGGESGWAPENIFMFDGAPVGWSKM